MFFVNRISRSWEIFKTSYALIMGQKKLLIFPAVSFVCTIVLAVLILGTGWGILEASGIDIVAMMDKASQSSGEDVSQKTEVIGFIAFALVYFCSVFIASFFSTAFYSQIMVGLRGEEVSISNGLGFAFKRIGAIFMWAMLAASVGLILKILEERLGWLGQLVIKLIGLVWAVATVFAIPVIVFDTSISNPIEVVKTSAGAIKKTWGESLVGFMGLGVLNGLSFVLFIFYAIGISIITAAVGAQGIAAGFLIATIPLAFLAWLAFAYIVNVAEKVYIATLYIYSQENFIPGSFSRELIANPWKVKR